MPASTANQQEREQGEQGKCCDGFSHGMFLSSYATIKITGRKRRKVGNITKDHRVGQD
jgi:hypothetical protein